VSETNVTTLRPMSDEEALSWLRSQPGGRISARPGALGRRWNWHHRRVSGRLNAWARDGLIRRRQNAITVLDLAPLETSPDKAKLPEIPVIKTAPSDGGEPVGKALVSSASPRRLTLCDLASLPARDNDAIEGLIAHYNPDTRIPYKTAPAVPVSRCDTRVAPSTLDVLAYLAAIALAGAAAWFSIRGMVVLFPGSPIAVVVMAVAMESSKLITAGWLSARWRATPWLWRGVLVALVVGLAVINAAGVASQLVAAHVGERGAAQSMVEAQDATLAAKIDVAARNVADIDRRLAQIDTAIETAAKRGYTRVALSAIDGQRKARAGLADERKRESATLVSLQTERARAVAHGRQIETEASPIVYISELLGLGGDSERAIRYLIALMVLCCDPLAVALTAATSARR
jgi:hypothetical protein